MAEFVRDLRHHNFFSEERASRIEAFLTLTPLLKGVEFVGGLEISWGTTLYQLVVFIILFLLLKRYAFGPLLNVMQTRQEKVENDLAEAAKSREEAEKLMSEQREEMAKVRREAQEILERAKNTADQQAQDLLTQAREEAERMKDDAQKEIQREKEQALAAVRDQVGTLSVLLASKIIEKEIDETAQKTLVDDYLKDVGERL